MTRIYADLFGFLSAMIRVIRVIRVLLTRSFSRTPHQPVNAIYNRSKTADALAIGHRREFTQCLLGVD
jgi:hypothetical protein